MRNGILFGVFVVLGLFSCEGNPTKMQRRHNWNTMVMEYLEFRRHEASGLCFAIGSGYRSGYLAHVPCEKVEHLLVKEE